MTAKLAAFAAAVFLLAGSLALDASGMPEALFAASGRAAGGGQILSLVVTFVIVVVVFALIARRFGRGRSPVGALGYRGHQFLEPGLLKLDLGGGGRTVLYVDVSETSAVERSSSGWLPFALVVILSIVAIVAVHTIGGAEDNWYGPLLPMGAMVAVDATVVFIAAVLCALMSRAWITFSLTSGHRVSVAIGRSQSHRLYDEVRSRPSDRFRHVELRSGIRRALNERDVAFNIARITSFGSSSRVPWLLILLAIGSLVGLYVSPVILLLTIVLAALAIAAAQPRTFLTVDGGFSIQLGNAYPGDALLAEVQDSVRRHAKEHIEGAGGAQSAAEAVDDDRVEFVP
jgi:hypothetical protein